jgi:hypothetical protein
MKQKRLTRILSLALSALLCLSLVPVFGSRANAASVTVTTAEGLKMALESTTTQTVVLGKDISANISTADGQWCIVRGTKILDLAGYEIDISNDDASSHLLFYLGSGTDLTINDSKGDGRITYNGYINDNGTLRTRNLFYIASGAKMTVNGGELEAGRSKKTWIYSLAQYLYKQTFGTACIVYGELVINGGDLYGRGKWPETGNYCAAVDVKSGGKVTMYGGGLHGRGAAPCIRGSGTIRILAGEFDCTSIEKAYINGKGYNYFDASSTGVVSSYIDSKQSSYTIKDKASTLAASSDLLVQMKSPVLPSSQTLKAGTVNSAYADHVAISSGAEYQLKYALVSGTIPAGMSLSSAGWLSGTPTSAGTYTFIVKATNKAGSSSSCTVTVTINPAKPVTTTISTPIAVKVTEPVSGNTPNFDLLSTPTGLTKQNVAWAQNGALLSNSSKFTPGDCECRIFLNVSSGYSLPSTLTATVNGKTAKITKVSDTQIRLEYHFTVAPEAITDIIVTGVKSPVAEAKASTSGISVATKPSTGVDRVDLFWADTSAGGTRKMDSSETFKAGGKYQLCVSVYPKSGYSFNSSVSVTFNGEAKSGGSVYSAGFYHAWKNYTCSATGTYVFPFTDVPLSAWYRSWVENGHRMGLINGETPTLFRPTNNLTYGATIKLAACMHQLYTTGSVTLTNGSPNWYDSYYQYCLSNGIIQKNADAFQPGYDDLYSKANEYITREMYVYIFARCLPDKAFAVKNNIPDNSIPDVPVTMGVMDDGIYKFYRAGILNGKNSYGTFGPDDLIDRGSVAAILVRMMDPSTRVDAPANLGA